MAEVYDAAQRIPDGPVPPWLSSAMKDLFVKIEGMSSRIEGIDDIKRQNEDLRRKNNDFERKMDEMTQVLRQISQNIGESSPTIPLLTSCTIEADAPAPPMISLPAHLQNRRNSSPWGR